jgi:hypothetical protein
VVSAFIHKMDAHVLVVDLLTSYSGFDYMDHDIFVRGVHNIAIVLVFKTKDITNLCMVE